MKWLLILLLIGLSVYGPGELTWRIIEYAEAEGWEPILSFEIIFMWYFYIAFIMILVKVVGNRG